MNLRETLARDLIAARGRTHALTDFDDDELRRQYHPLMSPLVWDLAHIGQSITHHKLRSRRRQHQPARHRRSAGARHVDRILTAHRSRHTAKHAQRVAACGGGSTAQ